MPKKSKINDSAAQAMDKAIGEGMIADMMLKRQENAEKLQNGSITLSQFDDNDLEHRCEALGLNHEALKAKFDDAVVAGYFAQQEIDAVAAYKTTFRLLNALVQDVEKAVSLAGKGGDPSKIDVMPREVSARDLIHIYSAAGNVTSADVADAEAITDPTVRWLERPLSLLNIYRKIILTTMELKEIQEDADKVEGEWGSVGEGVAFPQVDLGTKFVTRELTTVGAYFVLPQQVLRDSNKAHFMPYANVRLREKHMLYMEDQVFKGDGTGADMTGFKNDGRIATIPAALAAGQWTQVHLNSVADALASIRTSVYRMPQIILMHPNDFVKALKSYSANVGWLLGRPGGQMGTSGPPMGRGLPTIFGIPVIMSDALTELEWFVADLSEAGLYLNGGVYQRGDGLINDQLLKLQQSIVFYAFATQFNRRPKAIYKITQTAG